MVKKEPLVSVIVPTYGHENYIKQALDSILMQEVNFDYEILVGEDCSPDNTRKILKEYEKLHPNKFVMIYRDKNMGARKNSQDLLHRAKGKYLASLEGDDFWTDSNKLQRQVDFLEKNPEVIATAHNVIIIDKFGKEMNDKKYPECKDNWYTLKHYKKGILPGQTASIVRRNIYKNKSYDLSIMNKISPKMPGDRVSAFLLVSHGKFYCFQEPMSAYRYVTDSGTSFSAAQKKDGIVNSLSLVEYYSAITKHAHQHIDNSESIATIECIYLWRCVLGLITRYEGITVKTVKIAFCEIRNKKNAIVYVATNILKLPIKYLIKKKSR